MINDQETTQPIGTDSNIWTNSKGWISALNPRTEDIGIGDIVSGLSCIPRWSGQLFGGPSPVWWTVGHHTLKLLETAVRNGEPLPLLREIFMHDAAEAYVGDMTRGIKKNLPKYIEIELGFARAISSKFGTPSVMSDECREYDEYGFSIEATEFMPAGTFSNILIPRRMVNSARSCKAMARDIPNPYRVYEELMEYYHRLFVLVDSYPMASERQV